MTLSQYWVIISPVSTDGYTDKWTAWDFLFIEQHTTLNVKDSMEVINI